MRRICFIPIAAAVYSAIFVSFLFAGKVAADEPADVPLRFGVSGQALASTDASDSTAAIKAWSASVIREGGMKDIRLEISLYESTDALGDAMRSGGIEAAALTVEEYVRIGITPQTVFVPVSSSGTDLHYILLTRKETPYANLENLSPNDVIMYNAPRMNLARIWVRSILGASPENADTGSWIAEPGNAVTSKAILQVFFGQAKAALVTREAFDLACELNPQLRKTLMVSAESPPFIVTFMMLRPSWESPLRTLFEDSILNLNQTHGGRQVLTVYQSSSVLKAPVSILQPTIDFLTNHSQE